MNKILFCLLLFFVKLNVSSGQNFSPLPYNQQIYYADTNNYAKAIAIDSIKLSGDDTIFYNFKTLREDDSSYDIKASWLGEKVIKKNNGENIFFNASKDSIFINSQDTIGQTWKVFHYPDNSYILATVINIKDTLLFTVKTKVKYIMLQMRNSQEKVVPSRWNGFEILLSQQYGFIKIFEPYYFPDSYSPLKLMGSSAIEGSKTNLTDIQVLDLNPGDEIHSYSFERIAIPTYYEEKTIKKYMSKYLSKNADTIRLTYKLCKKRLYSDYGKSNYTFTNDTLTTEYISNYLNNFSNKNSIPEKVIYDGNTVSQTYLQYSSFHGRDVKWANPSLQYINGHYEDMISNCYDSYSYVEGMGGPYVGFLFDGPYPCTKEEITYFKKGAETWGIPYNCDSILAALSPEMNSPNIKIYPNPCFDKLHIETSMELTNFIITDISGKEIFLQKMEDKNDYEFDSFLMPGMYLIIFETKSGGKIAQKLFIN